MSGFQWTQSGSRGKRLVTYVSLHRAVERRGVPWSAVECRNCRGDALESPCCAVEFCGVPVEFLLWGGCKWRPLVEWTGKVFVLYLQSMQHEELQLI